MSFDPVFATVSPELDFPKEEREVLHFWKEHRIFEKTLARPAASGRFVFFEGPPTANGLPHNGHVLTRVIKDLFPRYKTMRGWSVPRKAGWDTHGLPVEVEVEKELRLHGKAAIEEYGVEPFIKKCVESVFRYTKQWEGLTERVAFWVDLRDAYVTYHRSYVESVWWALGELSKKGLLYRGHKIVWWWAQGGTALSSGEVGQGYRTVDDPSVFVAFPLVGEEDLSLLVWTTTPWTLPSNMYAAVRPEFEYAVVRTDGGRRFIVAKALVDGLQKKFGGQLAIEGSRTGRDLIGLAYRPPFDLFAADAAGVEDVVWRVVAAEFVTLDAGTGIVHLAPAFGEDDYDAHRKVERAQPARDGLPLFCAVKPDGTFVDGFDRYSGRWVKDCDKEIQHDLKDRGLLIFAETYRHDYPFCWRADSDPLIQYARPAWYIRTTAAVDRALENNAAIQWLPEHVKDGRFGDFLANNVDWALSRERWWGTPLNVWLCEGGHQFVPTSVAEIERLNPRAFDSFHSAKAADPTLSDHLIVHKPWVDQVCFPCPECGATMRRVPEVIDCWFDSGCMPFAQWGYPHAGGSREQFEASFPADFISEAIDQTRGWFYSLLMISTLVFGDAAVPHPFKTCIVLGHVTDKEGKKESKSKGNYTPPEIILDKVAMEFAVHDDPSAARGIAWVAREDAEGLDLTENARIRVYREDAHERYLDLAIRVGKGLRRRHVVLHMEDRATLGVVPTSRAGLTPALVPTLLREERVVLEDPATPAPGADAFRWFFYAASPPWSSTRHSLANVRALQKEFAVKLRNVYAFFTIYAGIDGFHPYEGVAVAPRPELDRWILSELALTVRAVTSALDAYDVFGAAQSLIALVDSLSNWWVRQSRSRFWRAGYMGKGIGAHGFEVRPQPNAVAGSLSAGTPVDSDKASAYQTLYTCLVTIAKMTAPFTPYAAERMWQNLVVGPSRGRSVEAESVHMADWPIVDDAAIDERLSQRIATLRALVSLGLQVRTQAKIKVRQPLYTARVITTQLDELAASDVRQMSDELNVTETSLVALADAAHYVSFRLKPNFRALGQRGLGKEAQALKKRMAAFTETEAASLAVAILGGTAATVDGIQLHRTDVEVEFVAKEGFAAAGDRVGVVVLDTRIDENLRDRGLLREVVNRVQTLRKELGLEYTDRIRLWIAGAPRFHSVVERWKDELAGEVLATEVFTATSPPADASVRDVDLEGEPLRLALLCER